MQSLYHACPLLCKLVPEMVAEYSQQGSLLSLYRGTSSVLHSTLYKVTFPPAAQDT